MAALTWRDVAAPNFAGVSQIQRQAGESLQNSLAGLADGLKAFQAERQSGIDNAILGRALQIQDPTAMREALSTGSLLQGVDLSKVNPKVLEALGQRTSTLLRDSATEQSIASSKLGDDRTRQEIAKADYDQGRKVRDDTLGDAAREQGAALFGSTGPVAKLSLEDQQRIATGRSGLATAALGRAATSLGMQQTQQNMSQSATNFSNAQADRADARAGVALADQLLQGNATVEDLRQNFEEAPGMNPQSRQAARAYLERTTGSPLYSMLDAAATGGRNGGAGGAAVDPTVQPSPVAAAALAETGRRVAQNSSAGVVADVEKNLNDTRSAPEVASELAKLYPEVDQAKLTGIISKAQSDNPGLSAADVGSAVLRSQSSNWWGSTRFADNQGIDDDAFKANLESLSSGKADYMSQDNQRTRAMGNAIKAADANVQKLRTELIQLQRRAQSQTGVDTSRAEERLEKAQQKLADAIQKQQDDPRFKPNYTK